MCGPGAHRQKVDHASWTERRASLALPEFPAPESALEQSRGSLVFMLAKYEHPVIFPVHPAVLVNYRKSRPSEAKDDPSDAWLLPDILTLHRDKLRRLRPDTPETRTSQFLVEERRKFVHEKPRYSNRVPAHLKLTDRGVDADAILPSLHRLEVSRLANNAGCAYGDRAQNGPVPLTTFRRKNEIFQAQPRGSCGI